MDRFAASGGARLIEIVSILMFAAPLIFAAMGDCVAQRSGVLNIGLEGQMLLSSFVGAVAAQSSANPWIGLLAAVGAGLALALVSAWFSITLCADQIVVGTAVTLLSLGITGSVYRAKFSQSAQALIAPSFAKVGGVDAVLVGSIFAVAALSFVLFRTRWGLRLRAAGEYPEAARSTGVSVARTRYTAMSIAGVLAGLAGGYLSIGVAGSFSENMTQGRGFVAIAMVTFGRWKPQWIFAACLLMGWLDSLQFTAQARGWNIPFQWLLAAPYVVAIFVLVVAGKGSSAPAALGKPFRGER